MNDVFKCSSEIRSGNELSYRAEDGRVAVTDKYGNGRYVILSERDRRELALTWLGETHDIHYSPDSRGGGRRIALTPKLKPVRAPQVGDFYRIPGEPDMAEPWSGSPIVKVVQATSPGYIWLETLAGDQTGWSDMRALGEPLKVAVQTEWVVEG